MSVISRGTAQRGQEEVQSVATSFESDGLNLLVDKKSGVQPRLRSQNVTSPIDGNIDKRRESLEIKPPAQHGRSDLLAHRLSGKLDNKAHQER